MEGSGRAWKGVEGLRSDEIHTRFISDENSFFRAPSVMICLNEMHMIVCARDEVAFICVAATVRLAVPRSISLLICSNEPTACDGTYTGNTLCAPVPAARSFLPGVLLAA